MFPNSLLAYYPLVSLPFSHCVSSFHDLSTGRRIVRSMKEEACLFGRPSDPYWFGCRSAWSSSTLALALGSSVGTKASVCSSYYVLCFLFRLWVLLGKHHRATDHSRVNNHSRFCVWVSLLRYRGPSRVPSIKDLKYFLLFVDDFSRMTWLYLLKRAQKCLRLLSFSLMR